MKDGLLILPHTHTFYDIQVAQQIERTGKYEDELGREGEREKDVEEDIER